MVYDSDFYTTRRPYRSSPAYSSYTSSYEPSRQVRILPGLGKVHIVHSYDRIVPYVGHKRLTVVTSPPKVFSTRPSVLQREYDWIERKVRPRVGYSATNRYLNSDSAVIFDNETSLIRAQTSALLRRIHDPVPRVQRLSWPSRYNYSDNYIHKTLVSSPVNSSVSYTTYYTEPVRKYIGTGHLSSVSYAAGRAYDRRPHIYLYENPLQSDIQLLSYYINKFKQEKAYSAADSSKVALSPARPSRRFGPAAAEQDAKQVEEMRKLREARAARLAFINEEEKKDRVSASKEVDEAVRAKKEKEEEARLAEERAIAEEQSRQKALAKEAARKAEIARQEELAAQAAAERAAELERQAEVARQEEAKKKAELERKRQEEEEERARLEEQRRIDEAKAEEALQAQLRLEQIARQAEEEREAELARQAEELAELARQEAELAEQAKREAEEEEERRQEAELADLRRQEAELAELERQQQEEAAQQAAEDAEKAKEEAEAAKRAAEEAELERQQAELEELERAQAELDALEEAAKAMESDLGPPPAQEEAEPEAEPEPEPEIDEAELARQAELEELRRQEEELEELERAQAELDALEAEAKAMESDLGPPPAAENNYDDEDDAAIAEDVPGVQSDEGED